MSLKMNSSELCELFLHPREEVQEIGRGPSSLTYQVEDIRTKAEHMRENGVEGSLQEKPLRWDPCSNGSGVRTQARECAVTRSCLRRWGPNKEDNGDP